MAKYIKNNAVQLSENFVSTEFDCKCKEYCSTTEIDSKLIEYLQKIREHFGEAVIINSAYRCEKHNKSIGGASKSKHLFGQAADIKVSNVSPLKVAQYAESIGIKGIGRYSNFVHIDTRENKFFWYGNEQKPVSTFGTYINSNNSEVRKMTPNEKRLAVVKKYEEILGRNNYSQSLRDYCYRKHSNGKYYSDCSSSISYAYKEAGFSFGILNTVGMYNSSKLVDVPVVIKNGIIQNPEVLRPGDMLLFAGTDSSRAYAGYVGHVEMVAKIGSTTTIYGHGSGTPRKTEMNAYCKSRYSKKTNTKLGHKGLIRVRRFILDDGETLEKCLYKGCVGADVTALQEMLVKLGYDLGDYGAKKNGVDGDYGSATEKAVIAFQQKYEINATGIANEETLKKLDEVLNGKTVVEEHPVVESKPVVTANQLKLKAGTWNVRLGPGTQYGIAESTKNGDSIEKIDPNDWIPVKSKDGKKVLWISPNAIQK